ncbi:MAG TPA: metal-dependent transcriptional regulator [Anaerolineaceae bacterium]|nr:metal-dependent transcriptional regulator [Anaerolineaceae bacterium]
MNSQESAEMYLETILILEKKNGNVRAIDIAHRMQFSRPTVSEQVKRLAADGYLELDADKHISLTPKGLQIAEETYNRHNSLAEIFIWMGVSQQTAFEDACRIEHYISTETFNALRQHYENDRKNPIEPNPD